MSLADIAAHLRDQKADEKAPIHWVEVPNAPRVVHVSEIPELWEAQTERDLRLAQAAIGSNRVIALLTIGASVTVLAFEAPTPSGHTKTLTTCAPCRYTSAQVERAAALGVGGRGRQRDQQQQEGRDAHGSAPQDMLCHTG